MKISPYAGKLAEPSMLVNVPALVTAYYAEVPDPSVQGQRVSFRSADHLRHILEEAQTIVNDALAGGASPGNS